MNRNRVSANSPEVAVDAATIRLAPNRLAMGALGRLGLARAYATQSETMKGRAAYQDFLTLWKDADPDIPILKQAKDEYARLQ